MEKIPGSEDPGYSAGHSGAASVENLLLPASSEAGILRARPIDARIHRRGSERSVGLNHDGMV
jgi:hypothetical protein